MENWADSFEELYGNPPETDSVLKTKDGSPAKVKIDLVEGKQPFVYGLAYVPDIVGDELGWFLVSETEESNYGIKCIMLPKARKAIIERFGLSEARVKAIRVVNKSKSGRSLLCEVADW